MKGNVVLKAYDAFAMDDIDTTVLTDNYAEARNTGYLYTNGGAGNTTTGNFYLGAPTTTADAGFSAPSWAQADAVYAVELFGTKTWDPGSVTSGGVPVTTTVTVPNVGAHMFIRVSFDLPLQGMQLTASYSAANTVTVVLSNLTGGAIDLGSGNLYVVASYLN